MIGGRGVLIWMSILITSIATSKGYTVKSFHLFYEQLSHVTGLSMPLEMRTGFHNILLDWGFHKAQR